jgi:hypothetical protein
MYIYLYEKIDEITFSIDEINQFNIDIPNKEVFLKICNEIQKLTKELKKPLDIDEERGKLVGINIKTKKSNRLSLRFSFNDLF